MSYYMLITLRVGAEARPLEEYMHRVAHAGQVYGLSFNWKKLELMYLAGPCQILMLDGTSIKQTSDMIYLGSIYGVCS